MTASRIVGTGHYVPEKVVTNFDVMKMMETSDEFIVTRTGVRERRYAEADVSATDLAAEACRAAVEDAGLDMQDVLRGLTHMEGRRKSAFHEFLDKFSREV